MKYYELSDDDIELLLKVVERYLDVHFKVKPYFKRAVLGFIEREIKKRGRESFDDEIEIDEV